MIKYFIHIILTIGLLLNTVSAQDIRISSRLDTNLIKIGEQVNLRVDIQYPKDADVVFPLMQDTIVEEIEIMNLLLDTILTQENINHYVANYTLTSFDSGYYTIPAQVIINRITGDTIASRELMLAVATFVIDTANQNQIFDIKAPLEAPWTLFEFLSENYPYILFGLLLIAILFVVLWYLKKRKNREPNPVKKVVPKEAAHIIALRDLDSLKDKKLWQNDRIKLYYVELSDIVRSYIEHRFSVMALEQTSDEIFDSIQRSKVLNNEQLSQLKQILSTADMAKFAKAKPLAHENDLALKNAYELIQDTKLIEVKQETELTGETEEEKDA